MARGSTKHRDPFRRVHDLAQYLGYAAEQYCQVRFLHVGSCLAERRFLVGQRLAIKPGCAGLISGRLTQLSQSRKGSRRHLLLRTLRRPLPKRFGLAWC